MAWWSRRKGKARGPGGEAEQPLAGRSDGPGMSVDRRAVRAHFESFIASRRGVEAYVEPPTTITSTTVILIAHDGEWTRRAVGSRGDAFELAQILQVPVYDVLKTGYPGRMREWNSRQRGKK